MIIKGVWLHNIKSYKDSVIAFPEEGITVIYGDVGSGKSSILSSIGFAIFGNVPSHQSDPLARFTAPTARDLLRRGATRGFIQLWVKSGGKDIFIYREIHSEGSRVADKGGWVLVIDENQRYSVKRLTATEMRGYILDLLGIPEEKTRARSRVFASAIYVPQFAIHNIISASPEERAEIVNRVLNLMKYSLAKNRIELLKKRIRREIDEKTREETRLVEEVSMEHKYRREIENIKSELEKALKMKDSIEKSIAELEGRLEKLVEEKERLQKVITELTIKMGRVSELEKSISQIKSLLRGLELSTIEKVKGEIKSRIEDLKRSLSSIVEEKDKLMRELDKLSSDKDEKMNIRDRVLSELEKVKSQKDSKLSRLREIESLEKRGLCPVCLQPVTQTHTQKIKSKIKSEIEELEVKARKLSMELENLKNVLKEISLREKKLKSRIKELDATIDKINSEINALNRRLLELVESEQYARKMEEFQRELDKLKSELRESKKTISRAEEVEREISSTKRRLEELRRSEREILERIASLKGELKRINEFLSKIDEKKRELDRIREIKRRYTLMLDFTKKYILNIISGVEKYVKATAYNAFREEFTRVFKVLMAGYDNIDVEIRDDFTPVFKVKVDGVHSTVETPSGGQLTSIALAYRLALNRVARSMIPQLREGLLILDEPTYGFSPERVELLKKVLFSPGGPKQVIVVTHDRTFYEDTLGGKVKTIRLELDPENTITKVHYEGIDKDYVREVKKYMEYARKLVYKYTTKPAIVEGVEPTFKPVVETVREHKKPTRVGKSRTLLDFMKSS